MSKSEFPTSLRIGLGMPVFSAEWPLKCFRSGYLNPYGDHLLGDSHGPYGIGCHDALSHVIWHHLLQDNKSCRREQQVWGDDNCAQGMCST